MSVPVRSDLDFLSQSRITGLLSPSAASEPATKQYVDNLVTSYNWKNAARVRVTTNINTASPGATLDGVTMATNDRVLLTAQSTGSQNGLWVWNGAAVAMSRPTDFDDVTANSLEILGAIVPVREGTSADTQYVLTNDTVTLGSTSLTWTATGGSAPAASETVAGIAEIATQAETDTGTDDLRFVTPLKQNTYSGRAKAFSSTYGDGVATSIAVTHNLGTEDVDVTIKEATGSKRTIIAEWQVTSTNVITMIFSAAPASGAIRVHVQTQPA